MEWMMAGVSKNPAFIIGETKTESGTKPLVYYNWYAVNDKRGLAPKGFHIPTKAEWDALMWELGGIDEAEKLKSGIFAGEQAGLIFETGGSSGYGNDGDWWSSTETDSLSAGALLASFKIGAAKVFSHPKGTGMLVRLLSDNSVSIPPKPIVYGEVADSEGNKYKTVQIGNQTWMAENLRSTKYNDGKNIPMGLDTKEWKNIKEPRYDWYSSMKYKYEKYGAIYNGYVALEGNPCPCEWHVATKQDMDSLLIFTQSNPDINFLKSKNGWKDMKGKDRYGFAAIPAGYLNGYGVYVGLDNSCNWWSSTKEQDKVYMMFFGSDKVYLETTGLLYYGYQIRCVKDRK